MVIDNTGEKLPAEAVARIKSLVIPPAWEDVWKCPVPNGHLQAVGVDAAGRKQYRFHPEWRTKRDAMNFDGSWRSGVSPPGPGPGRRCWSISPWTACPLERAAATAVRLLDLGHFRIGSAPTPTRTAASG